MPRRISPIAVAVAAFVLALALNTAYTTWAVNTSQHRFCTTVGLVGAQKPPPGNPQANPSRAYLQELHLHFTQLYRSPGCP
jgi:hypothetical protein